MAFAASRSSLSRQRMPMQVLFAFKDGGDTRTRTCNFKTALYDCWQSSLGSEGHVLVWPI